MSVLPKSEGVYEYRFDKERMLDYVRELGKEEWLKYPYRIGWNSARFLEKGDVLYTVELWGGKYPVYLEKSGYVIPDSEGSYHGFKNVEDQALVFTLITDIEKVADLFPSKCNMRVDDFDGSISIDWTEVCGECVESTEISGGYSLYYRLGQISLGLRLINGIPMIFIPLGHYYRLFSKGDRFDLLFDNGEMLSFSLTTKPSKQTGTYFPLTESDMQVLLNEKLVKVRLYSSSRSDLKIICDNAYYKENAELSRVLFKRYVLTYWNALLESGFQWENIVSSQDRKINSSDNSSDPCYVYLMVDTTNGYHKIGISSHPEYREHTLQSEKPTIELLAAKQFPTRTIASAIESALHAAFGEKRLRGEWFELSEKDVHDIRRTLE